MKLTIQLLKETYSEQVVRKSLYWQSEYCEWNLEEDEQNWKITLFSENNDIEHCQSNFKRLLNDFKLREKLDLNTKNLRQKIINSALQRIVD